MERPSSGVGSLSICTMPKKRVGSPPLKLTGVRMVSSSTMPLSAVAATEDRQTGWRDFSAWRSSEASDSAGLGFPMGQEAGALELEAETLAQRRCRRDGKPGAPDSRNPG